MSRPSSGSFPRSRLSLSAQGKASTGPFHLEELLFVDTFTRELPRDPLTQPAQPPLLGGPPAAGRPSSATLARQTEESNAGGTAPSTNPARTARAVRGACYSLVTPDNGCTHPLYIASSPSAIELLGIDREEPQRREFGQFLSGARALPRAHPWAAIYGGHQFGCYAGQLGDGRCVSIGEVLPPPPPSASQPAPGASTSSDISTTHWDIQLKGAGLTPYSRFGDGLTTLGSCVREFVAAEYMHSIGIPTTRALAVVATQVPVYRGVNGDIFHGAVLTRLSPSWIRFGSFELFHYRNDKERVKLLADYVIKYHFADLLQPPGDDEADNLSARSMILGGSKPEGAQSQNSEFDARARKTSLAVGEETGAARPRKASVAFGSEIAKDEKSDGQHSPPMIREDSIGSIVSEEDTTADKGAGRNKSDSDDDQAANKGSDDDDEDDVLDDMRNSPLLPAARRPTARRLSFMLQSFPTQEGAPKEESTADTTAKSPPQPQPMIPETVLVDVELNVYARFFQEVIRRTAELVAAWQAIGFVHGALNTDNMSILGITLNYGAFGFLDRYDPYWTSNPADRMGRYRFEHQPKIALWNLSKLGRTLAALIAPPPPASLPPSCGGGSLVAAHVVRGEEIVRELLKGFEDLFIESYTRIMRSKLGLRTEQATDLTEIIEPLLQLFADAGADYTLFFRGLCEFDDDEGDGDALDESATPGPNCLAVLIRGVERLEGDDDPAADGSDEVGGHTGGAPELAGEIGTLAASMSGAFGIVDREVTGVGEWTKGQSLEQVGTEQDIDKAKEDNNTKDSDVGDRNANVDDADVEEQSLGSTDDIKTTVENHEENRDSTSSNANINDSPQNDDNRSNSVANSEEASEEQNRPGTESNEDDPPLPSDITTSRHNRKSLRSSTISFGRTGSTRTSSSSLGTFKAEIRSRWEDWSDAYRARLEDDVPHHASSSSSTTTRRQRMYRANPPFIPRSHVLNTLAAAVAARLPEPDNRHPIRRAGLAQPDPDLDRALKILCRTRAVNPEDKEDERWRRLWASEPPIP
ncbi:hypothetical protein PhCBS80983_g02359 [Powellomyces hirtus]|uniref:Selenoprotein O n=1 Tax=Powellomyces hirtus TaxID=109895 RepID=A0A507E6B1_9FUNG|nr:hypothetical protein PhCBS80983_g02359 [Powellomyces hirtus]